MTHPDRQSLPQVFAMPALLAALSLFGLVASLVGDGAWDVLGAAALLVPAGVALVKLGSGPIDVARVISWAASSGYRNAERAGGAAAAALPQKPRHVAGR